MIVFVKNKTISSFEQKSLPFKRKEREGNAIKGKNIKTNVFIPVCIFFKSF